MTFTNKDADTQMLDIGFDVLDLVKLNPFEPLLGWALILALTNTTLRIINMCLCFAMLDFNNPNMASVTKFTKSAAGLLQGSKIIVPIFYRKHLRFIRKSVSKFWDKTHEIKNEYKPLERILKFYRNGLCITFIAVCIKAVIEKDVLFPVYIPNSTIAYVSIFLGQCFQFLFDLFYVIAMDCIYLASCGIIWRQYKLLGEAFEGLNRSEDVIEKRRKFKDCVDHHNFLLKYIGCVREINKYPFLVQFLISVGSICIEFYNASEGLSPFEMILCVVYTGAVLCQLCVFCFPADMTSDAADDFSLAVYNFDWYNSPLDIQNCLPIVLNEAQKGITFTAGGLIKINKNAFTIIFKTAMSFMTFMKQMSNK